MSKELEALEQIKNFLGYSNWTMNLSNEFNLIEQTLIQTENCLGARRNGKALEQMYHLVNYSKAPMKPSLWVANIDGKIEQRVIMEKEDYDTKSKKELAFDAIKEKIKYKGLDEYMKEQIVISGKDGEVVLFTPEDKEFELVKEMI